MAKTNNSWKFWDSVEEMFMELFPTEKKQWKDSFIRIRMGMEFNSIRHKDYSKEDAEEYMRSSFSKVKLELKNIRKQTAQEYERIYGRKFDEDEEKTYNSIVDFITKVNKELSSQLYLNDNDLPVTIADDHIILINCEGDENLRIEGNIIWIYSNKIFTCKSIIAKDVLFIGKGITARTVKAERVGICTDTYNIDQLKSKTDPIICLPTNENTWDYSKFIKKFEDCLSENLDDMDTEATADDLEKIKIIDFGNRKYDSSSDNSVMPSDEEFKQMLESLNATELKEFFTLLKLEDEVVDATKKEMIKSLSILQRMDKENHFKVAMTEYIQLKQKQKESNKNNEEQPTDLVVKPNKPGGKITI